jgi:ABC-type Fe3+-hydroxamate transport system substrate-binding protein
LFRAACAPVLLASLRGMAISWLEREGTTPMPPHAPPAAALIDAAGRPHRPVGDAARIASLVPSITELLFDLGLGASVVGRTAFCVHPEGAVRRARSVGGTKQVNMDKLRRLEPTHVIVNIDETPRRLADDLAALGCTVVVTHPIEPEDNLALFRLIGGLFGREAAAEALCGRLLAALASINEAARALPEQAVLYLIWKDPWMTVSPETYISRMLALVNWRTIPGRSIPGGMGPAVGAPEAAAGVRYPAIELGEEILAGCARVLFSSEPFPFTERHLQAFRQAFPAHAAKAAMIDGQMVSWYGSRAIAGLDYLRRFALAGRTR